MNSVRFSKSNQQPLSGVFFALTAFLIWGASPVYWKVLGDVPALEIISHRVVWSFVFLLPLLWWQGRWPEFIGVLKMPRIVATLLLTALLVAANWLIYIWAVNHGLVLQASLGYYINPLVNVLLGALFLRERLRRFQYGAVLLASAGVVYLTLSLGQFPWVSLTLAVTFGIYGLIRKIVAVGALVGLLVETALLSLPALIYLGALHAAGTAAFGGAGLRISFFLTGSALVTALPLLCFSLGARRLSLASLGFLQYVAPSCMFLLGVLVYEEPFSAAQMKTFLMIWAALAIYSADSILFYRRRGCATRLAPAGAPLAQGAPK